MQLGEHFIMCLIMQLPSSCGSGAVGAHQHTSPIPSQERGPKTLRTSGTAPFNLNTRSVRIKNLCKTVQFGIEADSKAVVNVWFELVDWLRGHFCITPSTHGRFSLLTPSPGPMLSGPGSETLVHRVRLNRLVREHLPDISLTEMSRPT